MPRLPHGAVFDLDPDIERTFNRRRRVQRALLQNPPPPVEMAAPEPNPEEEVIRLANSRNGGIMDYAIPMLAQLHTGIRRPHVEGDQSELKPIMFHMLQTNGQFAGLLTEDPHLHLKNFMELTDSFHLGGVSVEALRLKLFPWSLRDRAKAWYNSLAPDSITTWNEMAEKFLRKYFPPTRNAQFRNEICQFKQLNGEAVPEAWERYKELLRKCPHHGIPYCIQLETFYNGLDMSAKQMLDATAGGAFISSTYTDGYNILEKIANNSGQWMDPRAIVLRPTVGTPGTDPITALTAQLTAMNTMLQNMNAPAANTVAAASVSEFLPVV